MLNGQLHRVQIAILYTLRHTEAARFTTLMQPTGLESDTFKFHIRKLVNLELIQNSPTGYHLTPQGKEFANNLDESKQSVQRQPKLSVLLLVPKPPAEHDSVPTDPLDRVFLFQKRRRNPFYGFWSCIGGPIQWGDDAADTATHELKKQTGLQAACTVHAFYRKRDYEKTSDTLLEDKLFVVLEATNVQGQLSNDWPGGLNTWMTLREYKQQPKHFSSVYEALELIDSNTPYTSRKAFYNINDY